MNLPKLGHAVIINNIASEMPGSKEDVKALYKAYKTVGFDVQVEENLTEQVLNLQQLSSKLKQKYYKFSCLIQDQNTVPFSMLVIIVLDFSLDFCP